MKDFILEVYPSKPHHLADRCRICDIVGLGEPLTHRVVLNDQIEAFSCAKHIHHAINDAFAEASMDWRIRFERPHIASRAIHRTALDAIELAGKARRAEINHDEAADALKSLALRVHEAARYLEHYENMYGGNDNE